MSTNEDLTNEMVIMCPHCKEPIVIEKLNCGIFRHGTIIQTGQQMNPHETREMCDFLFANKKIYGCGKPFQIVMTRDDYNNGTVLKILICDYI
jgi:hypothetical protein